MSANDDGFVSFCHSNNDESFGQGQYGNDEANEELCCQHGYQSQSKVRTRKEIENSSLGTRDTLNVLLIVMRL